ncbi:MAG: helix-turn-helix domain-containing protein [Bacteroidota bacterium]|uniref:Helix-turn-helix domain-containing protein n=1 Tax=Flagellimonas profundi TaxID=2915620 RepID=A0ABS3FJE0_9FLAO|nr:helix-turn-helix domain-containing protein [Allomuricauda profundi]MBO0343288.1 helix-turn-helix domain-containing protein [Allomuricauda profundi]MEC7771568.1 helix-turn-helix domain-containing protein [Bacteroidota bacterium]
MSASNPILTTIIFVFAAQAIVLGILLLTKRPRSQSNIFLSLLIFFFALMALNIALVNVLRTYNMMDTFRYVQLELLYGIGPALYFYTKSITDHDFKFSKKDLVHFAPVVLEFIFYRTAIYRLGSAGLYQTPAHPYTKYYLTEQWLGVLSITLYTIISLVVLFRYQNWLKQRFSNLENKSLNWLKAPIIIYSAFWIGWNILSEIDRFVFDRGLREMYFLPAFVGLAIVSYWIGFKGYLKSQTETSGYSSRKTTSDDSAHNPKWASKITKVMESKKPYLDPELDLTKLSELADLNPKQVSHTINRSFSKNFYEYVNGFRVEEFKQLAAKPENKKLTLLGLAFECGFKSKSTFNDAFKKITGKTPSQYVNQKKESEKKQSVAP